MTGRHRGPSTLPSARRLVLVAALGCTCALTGGLLAACTGDGHPQPARPAVGAYVCDGPGNGASRCAERAPLGDAIGRALAVRGGVRG